MYDHIIDNQTLPVNVEPSGIFHGFDIAYAIAYGVDEAIMLKNFVHFISANANRGHNLREGRYWTYDRLEDFPNHFPYWTVKQVRRILASLIQQEVIIKGEFNDKWSERTQWYAFKDQDKFIKFIKPPKTPLPVDNPDLPKRATESCPNGQLTNAQTGNCYNDTTTVATTIPSTPSLKVPEEPDAASAACAGGDDFPKPKPKREKSEFSIKVREVANQMLNILAQYSPVYRPPSDMTKFLSHVQEMIERDKQDPAVVLKAFEWALADNEKRGDFNGWQGIVATNNKGGKTTTPAEIFRKHFSKIHSQMGSREKRKFAPCSNNENAMAAMAEMNARAI